MRGRRAWFEALRVLRERERDAEQGWVLSGDLLPDHQLSVQAAAGEGLAELADREVRAELSAWERRPVLWAARLSPSGHDVLTYMDAGPAPATQHQDPAEGERLVELRPVEMDALRVFVRVGAQLRVPPADGLADRVCTAHFDRAGNRWSLCLDAEQIQSVAYALYLRSMGGSITEANRFAREYGVAFRMDVASGGPRPFRLRRPSRP
ncbi:DUF6417 family protein [Streptomyces yokosukanensis]|uniref:DUF6417 family protein n=1 Tax=Streptomyces yokosukanensis TaxID=67386 RepID=UPI00082C58D6|nr:DUF6417 family protein [Streptomyces yokosukanensis]